MEDRAMKYEKPVLDGFHGWDCEFAVGASSSEVPDPCPSGGLEIDWPTE